MALWRFTQRAFHLNRIVEAGEVVELSDGTIPGRHMVDMTAEDAGQETANLPAEFNQDEPVFRADLAADPVPPVTE